MRDARGKVVGRGEFRAEVDYFSDTAAEVIHLSPLSGSTSTRGPQRSQLGLLPSLCSTSKTTSYPLALLLVFNQEGYSLNLNVFASSNLGLN